MLSQQRKTALAAWFLPPVESEGTSVGDFLISLGGKNEMEKIGTCILSGCSSMLSTFVSDLKATFRTSVRVLLLHQHRVKRLLLQTATYRTMRYPRQKYY